MDLTLASIKDTGYAEPPPMYILGSAYYGGL